MTRDESNEHDVSAGNARALVLSAFFVAGADGRPNPSGRPQRVGLPSLGEPLGRSESMRRSKLPRNAGACAQPTSRAKRGGIEQVEGVDRRRRASGWPSLALRGACSSAWLSSARRNPTGVRPTPRVPRHANGSHRAPCSITSSKRLSSAPKCPATTPSAVSARCCRCSSQGQKQNSPTGTFVAAESAWRGS